MQFCTHCGAALPEGSRFCASCGQPVNAPAPRQEAGPSQTVVAPTGAQQTYQALAQPSYQSVPQQPAYDYDQNSVRQTPQKGMSRGTLAAVIAAIVLVATAAAAFVVLDPLGVIAPKHEAPATSAAAESQSAQSRPAKTTPATQPAPTDAATTQSATPTISDYILPDVQTRVYSTAELERLSTDEL